MKNTFKLLLALFVCLSGLMLYACTEATATGSDTPLVNQDSIIFTHAKIKQVQAITQEVKQIDSTQFGLCDTCVAEYKGVIMESRLLAKEISRQNSEMAMLKDSSEMELRLLRTTYANLKRFRKDVQYRYALAKNQDER